MLILRLSDIISQYKLYLIAMKTNKFTWDQKKLAAFEEKVEVVISKYRELRSCEIPLVKVMIIQELRKLASEIQDMMRSYEHPSFGKRRRQIDDVLKKCLQIENQLQEQSKKEIGGGGRHNETAKELQSIKTAQLSKKALYSVIYHEVRASDLTLTPNEYDQIYNHTFNNEQLMKDIEIMVEEQERDVSKVSQFLCQLYQSSAVSNEEPIQESNQQEPQKTSKKQKFKKNLGGFFASLGNKCSRLPGKISGLFGHK